MSARIIIEKDGERYEPKGLTAKFFDGENWLCIENEMEGVTSPFTKLPPVKRTDNSEVIARLKAENAELKKTIEDNLRVAKACRDSDQDDKFELRQERSRLICENAKLREALKPIMEFRVAPAKWITIKEMYHKAFDAVRNAQEIMKGGAE